VPSFFLPLLKPVLPLDKLTDRLIELRQLLDVVSLIVFIFLAIIKLDGLLIRTVRTMRDNLQSKDPSGLLSLRLIVDRPFFQSRSPS
jgi:hypothetical protein